MNTNKPDADDVFNFRHLLEQLSKIVKPENKFNILEDMSRWTGVPIARVQEIMDAIGKIHVESESVLLAAERIKAYAATLPTQGEKMVAAAAYGRMIQWYAQRKDDNDYEVKTKMVAMVNKTTGEVKIYNPGGEDSIPPEIIRGIIDRIKQDGKE